MTTAKTGLAGQFVSIGGPGSIHAAQVTLVHADGSVDSRSVGATSDRVNLPFVDVGGTPPPSDHFQAIDSVN